MVGFYLVEYNHPKRTWDRPYGLAALRPIPCFLYFPVMFRHISRTTFAMLTKRRAKPMTELEEFIYLLNQRPDLLQDVLRLLTFEESQNEPPASPPQTAV